MEWSRVLVLSASSSASETQTPFAEVGCLLIMLDTQHFGSRGFRRRPLALTSGFDLGVGTRILHEEL